jgi:peptide chain release factor 2
VAELEKVIAHPSFWSDNEKAAELLRERNRLVTELDSWHSVDHRLEEAEVLVEILREGDQEAVGDLTAILASLSAEADRKELETIFTGDYDRNNAILNIHPGAGGTESQDWAQMLLRMYARWIERKGFTGETLDYLPGEEAGIKNVTLLVKGEYAYGLLSAEAGVHRLVRISPFDAGARRHTSFCSIFVYPELDDDIAVDIKEEDLRIDTYRSSGAGGQHVNVTDSAVRITHLPTGIVVQCQNERSQHKNRSMAMKVLKARLYELERQKQMERMENIQGEKKDIAWGSQIRSYVLHPYRMIKDHRTGFEVGNVDPVLDGELDEFIQAYLLHKHRQQIKTGA